MSGYFSGWNPTPGFGMSPPYNPITGIHAGLKAEGINPFCAMVQVSATDNNEDYVTCRLYDPRIRKFITSVSVAKPYGKRTTGEYAVGQVFPAFLPTTAIGQNPGAADGTEEGGQPADLNENVSVLTDTNSKSVNWLMIDAGVAGDVYFELKDALSPGSNATAHPLDDAGDADTDIDLEFEVYDRWSRFRGRAKDAYGSPNALGSQGRAKFNAKSDQWEITELEPSALMIRGLLTAALATTDGSRTIDNVEVMQPIGGIVTNTDPASAITVFNTGSIFEGDNNGNAIAVWNEDGPYWEFIQVECPA